LHELDEDNDTTTPQRSGRGKSKAKSKPKASAKKTAATEKLKQARGQIQELRAQKKLLLQDAKINLEELAKYKDKYKKHRASNANSIFTLNYKKAQDPCSPNPKCFETLQAPSQPL
jgi:hypothetical protein